MTTSETWPSCTIIIPTRDAIEYLKPCVEGALASDYPGELELIIIDNGSRCRKTLSYMDSLLANPRVHLLRIDEAFNFSRLNNIAVQQANGELLCFMNNDIVIDDPQWLQHLAHAAMHPEVGAVGPVLLYPDNRVQHGGVSLDADWVGLHIGHGRDLEDLREHYVTDQWYPVDAVTAAAMLTRRKVFLDVGGFDEKHLPISFNDVDYCLKLQREGLRVLVFPAVTLLHHESVSRRSDDLPVNQARAQSEKSLMQSRWQAQLGGRNYQGEIPWRKKSDDPERNAALPLESVLHDVRVHLSGPGNNELLKNADDSWHRRFRLLEIEYRALLAENQNLRRDLDTIINSRSWRSTAPVRALLLKLRLLKHAAGRQLVSSRVGRKIYQQLRGSARSDAATSMTPDIDYKQNCQQEAEAALESRLASGQKLPLPVAEQPHISVILVLYNQAPLTLLCLESLIGHTDQPLEVIIVDNASSDRTDELLELCDGAHVIRNGDNRGFVEAVNQGAAVARGRHLLLLNNDAQLQPGAIDHASELLDSDSGIGAVGGRIILLDGSLQEAGSIIWQDGSCLGYGRGDDPDKPEYMFRRDVDYCSGAFLMTPRACFETLDGFDLDYAPAYYEESDYCIRLQKQGYRIVYEPRAVITHYEFASSGGFSGASALQEKNRETLVHKHHDYLQNQRAASTPGAILQARTADRKPRLLFIDDRVPHVDLGAGYPRCRDLLQGLTGLGFTITFYPLRTSFDEWEATYATLPAETEVMLYRGKDDLERFLVERQGLYDCIVISRDHNMQLFNDIVARHPALTEGTRIVYDAEAVVAPREAQRLRLAGQPVDASREQAMIREEISLADATDTIITVSEAEARLYADSTARRVEVLGHTLAARPTASEFGARRNLLFVGALRDDKSPNVDSLLWFCDRVFPIIRAGLGDEILLYVVGDNSAPALDRLRQQRSGIRFLGRQEDLVPLYDSCRVFLAPTRFAAGIPHKVHEAAAHGIPVVATSLLAGQLQWQHESELLVADNEEGFARECIRLHENEALWNDLRERALEAVNRECSPERFQQKLASIFRDWP